MKKNKGEISQQPDLKKLQAVLYLKSFDLSNPLSLAVYFQKDKILPFDAPETVMPIPPSAPLEIPRVILRSKNGMFTCNISANRIDLFYNQTSDSKLSFEQGVDRIKKYLRAINKNVQNDFNAKAHRIAVIFNIFTGLDISSREFLKKKYLKGNVKIEDIFMAQLNILSKEKVGNFKTNKWLRINTLRKEKDSKDDKAVQIVFDINTLPEIDYEILSSSITQFIDAAYKNVESSLKSLLKV